MFTPAILVVGAICISLVCSGNSSLIESSSDFGRVAADNGSKVLTPEVTLNVSNACKNPALDDPQPRSIGSPLAGYVNHVVSVYRKILRDTVVQQVDSWNYLSAYVGVDETTMDSCPRVTQKVRSAPSALPPDDLEEFIWDDEADAAKYLMELYEACSKDAVEYAEFKTECWDFLRDLIYTPRCTTRFDSRVKCEEGTVPDMTTAPSEAESILEGHFAQDTLNVVVVGAGPTGLFLANALAEANGLWSKAWRPKIRVVVIENRCEASGVKQGFVRNWQTIPPVEGMVQAIDARVGAIFSGIAYSDYFALPLNALETLLLLSSRDLGVKFLYGNLTEYTSFLAKQPNLVVFDSTGHHLDGLVRGSNCPRPEETPGIPSNTAHAEETVRPWSPTVYVDSDGNHIVDERYELLKAHSHIVDIARKGKILYPVTKQGIPYATWWLHVHEIPYDQGHYDHDYFWNHYANSTDMCEICNSDDEANYADLEEHGICYEYCKPNNFFDSGGYYRDDIYAKIAEDDTNVWFATRGANVHLSAAEAKRLLELIKEAGYYDDPVGMPMDRLPLSSMAQEEIFKDTLLMEGLEILASVDEGVHPPLISVFQHRPYIYQRGEIQGDLFGKSTPILRIGDSLATGDPNRSSGFVTHVWMVRRLVCRIRGEDDECTKDQSGYI